ncbi:MAG: MarR family transcriptional regulator [Dyella sp.]
MTTAPSAPASNLQLDAQLCFALYAASRSMTAIYRPLLEPLGLTYPQYLVMLVLWQRDGQSVRELGVSLLLDSGTLTPLLKRLQSAGLLNRQRRTQDEREVEIRLTKAGHQLRERARDIPGCIAERIGMPIDPWIALRTELRGLISRLNLAAAQPAAASPPTPGVQA